MARFFAAVVVAAAAVKLGAASEYTCEAPPGTSPGGITKVEGGGVDWMAPVVVQEGIETNPNLRTYKLYNVPQYLLGGLYISSGTWPGQSLNGRWQLKIEYTAPARIFIWTEVGSNDGGLKALLDGNDNDGFEPVDLSGLATFTRRGNSGSEDVLKLYSKLFLTGNTIFVGPLEGTTVAGVMSNCDVVSTTATTTTTTTLSTTTITTSSTTFTTTSSTMTSSTSTYTGTSSTRTTSTSTTVTTTTTTSTTVTTSTTTTTTTTLHSVLQIDAVATFSSQAWPKCSTLRDDFNNQVDPDGGYQETVDAALASAVAGALPVVEPHMVFIISASERGQDVAVDFQIFVPFEPAYSAGIGVLYWNQTRSTLEQAIRDRVLRTYTDAECPAMNVSIGDPTFKITWSDLFYENLRTTTQERPQGELDDGLTMKAASGGLLALLGMAVCCVGGLVWWWTGMLKKCFACLLEWKGRQFFQKFGRKPTVDLEGQPDDEGMFDLPQTLEQTDSGNVHVKPIEDVKRKSAKGQQKKGKKDEERPPDDTPTSLRLGRSMAFRKNPSESQGRLPVPEVFGAKGVVQGSEDPFALSIEDQAAEPQDVYTM